MLSIIVVFSLVTLYGLQFLAGEVQDEDLVVLLSERAARGIYQKWIDTLIVCSVHFHMHTLCM